MTDNTRRQRSDSTPNLHRVMAGANMEIGPPAHIMMTDDAWPFFHSIVKEFAKADWSSHGLTTAAFLARTMGQLEVEQRALCSEEMVLRRADGSQYLNPRLRIVDRLMSQMLATRRSLGLTGRAKAGGSRDVARMREANRRIELAAEGDDDLLA